MTATDFDPLFGLDPARLITRSERGQALLIVEDEADARSMLRRLIEKEGWAAVEAENGREGLDRIAAARPSLIFTDLMMPVMDGFEFVEELQRVDDWKEIPVIVLSAMDLTDEDRKRLNGHVERVLHKGSHSGEDLIDRLRELVGTASTD